jgi:hypothetical protein
MTPTLYDNIVTVIEIYLGPAGQRFVDRQITSHLQKSPEDVTPDDLEHLKEWIRVSMSLLTDDRRTVDECMNRLIKLI